MHNHYTVNILGSFSGADNHVSLVEIFSLNISFSPDLVSAVLSGKFKLSQTQNPLEWIKCFSSGDLCEVNSV